MKLVKYKEINKDQFFDYINEWKGIIVPWSCRVGKLNFNQLMNKWTEHDSEAMYAIGNVPSTLYFMVNNDDKIVGAVEVRHALNEKLTNVGGHVGYGIRPSERGNGYSTLILKMILNKFREMDFEKILVTCDESNIASTKAIEKNNGKLENVIEYENELIRRYWITLRTNIEYVIGGKELIEELKPLWENLNNFHMESSKHFKERFANFTFEERKNILLDSCKQVRIILAKDTENDKYIGYSVSTISLDGIGEFDSLYLDSGYRGHSIGEYLTEEGIKWLKDSNVKKVIIGVSAGNEGAFYFYEKYGFYPKVTILEQP